MLPTFHLSVASKARSHRIARSYWTSLLTIATGSPSLTGGVPST